MSKTDYIICFSSTKFSHGILTEWAAVMFGLLIQKRKGKLNYILFPIKNFSPRIVLISTRKTHIITLTDKISNIIKYPTICHSPSNI